MTESISWNLIILKNESFKFGSWFDKGNLVVVCRPVGTNLILVQRVRANNLLSMKEKWAERLYGMGSRGPLKGPWRGPGAEPRQGSWGQCPRKLLGFSNCKKPRKALLKIFFSLNQPTSAWYRNVSIKCHSSRGIV